MKANDEDFNHTNKLQSLEFVYFFLFIALVVVCLGFFLNFCESFFGYGHNLFECDDRNI